MAPVAGTSSPESKLEGASAMATPGGSRLRALREQAGRSQLWAEMEAGLGSGYLQRVESGRVGRPERDTLERVLDALDARYSERRDILEAFGYVVSTPPPADDEVAWARLLCARELAEAPLPAYVLDCAHRLAAWNRLVPPLLGIEPAIGQSMLTPWFQAESPIGRLVANPEEFLAAMIRAFRFEMRRCREADWCRTMMEDLLALPAFRHHFRAVEAEPEAVSTARALVAVRLRHPDGELAFRLAAEPFLRDDRFRIVYFFPADPPTMAWCGRAA
jgi:transcriptional regulator with XRE-family HTH domain